MGAGTAGSDVLGERIIVLGKKDLVGQWGLEVGLNFHPHLPFFSFFFSMLQCYQKNKQKEGSQFRVLSNNLL